jgi:hypothetical protein
LVISKGYLLFGFYQALTGTSKMNY